MVHVLVRLDRLGTVEQVLVVRGHGCRLVRELHQHSGPGGRLREVFGVVVVGAGRQLYGAEKVFEVVQPVLPNMDSQCLLAGRTRALRTVAQAKPMSPDTFGGPEVEQMVRLEEAAV